TGNHVYLNTAASAGGGIALWNSDNATLANNWVYSNTSDGNGGGIYLGTAPTATLLSNWVYSNTADSGGGIFLGGGTNATLTDNDIYRNAAATDGGGIVLGDSSDATVRDNQVYSNTATEDGGGIAVTGNCHDTVVEHNDIHDNIARRYGGGIYTSNAPTLTLMHNQIYSNTALASGGGLHCQTSDAMLLAANDIHSNLGGGGGGIVLYSSDDVTLAGNQIYANTAITYNGGGLAADFSTGIRLVNNLVVDNRALASDRTPGIHIVRSDARFLHNTLARNTGGSGVGLLLHSVVTDYATAALTNTILVSHAVGIEVGQNSTATLAGTLWGEGAWANGDDWGGPGAIISSTNVTGDPAFVDPDGGDYHITGASAGRDVAVSTVVTDDIDGDSRPFGAGPDIGADEAQCHARLNGTYYRSVQAAVDASASPTDVVQVAGTCRGVETRASYDQVVYISKTLTVRGGYSPDFSAWDPQVYPTTLDAQEQGRVIRIAGTTPGSITPTLEGLRLTNGRINNWGGGVLSRFASTIISGCHIYNNTSANQFGGGIYIDAGPNAALVNSQVYSNSAGTSFGGGLYIAFSDDVISVGNTFHNNTAASGGGMYLYHSDATLVNNVVADNEASDRGSGLYISNCSPRLLHTTIARNSGESGQAIYVSGSGHTVWMTNTILVSHTVGITVTGGNTATLEATLWGGGDWANDLNWGGDGHIVGSANVTGDPSFVDPDGGDYHITGASAAVDEGVPMWVSTDIDGDARTVSSAPDLGADESTFVLKVVKAGPAWVSEGAPIAYTLRVTNTGLVTAVNVVLTDSLPAGAGFVSASDGGGLESSDVVTWPTFTLAPNGGSVARTFTVTATETITNDDYMAAPQGLPGVRGAVVVATYVNHAPTANAEAIPNTLHTGAVTLDGSGSSDPDGDALSYQWAQTGGPVAVSLAGAGAMTATFTAPLFGGVYTFTLAVSDTYDLSDSDTTAVTVTLPVIAIAKSGPDEVEVGEPITYTLIVTNSGSLAASSLVITDALPTGASFIAASDGGLLVGDVVSWTATSLGMMDRLTRTFTVTATETITNSDYRASCGEGVSAVGTVSVVTEVSSERKIYLPLVLRGFQ
ncbi:MAG: right-handed parallel beta-helix repeat-containing protein, partial [Chloroflexota bacterium]|nr:right-handed parallel beta-helix repeat-containing protein [Chloroflexota bacterium]